MLTIGSETLIPASTVRPSRCPVAVDWQNREYEFDCQSPTRNLAAWPLKTDGCALAGRTDDGRETGVQLDNTFDDRQSQPRTVMRRAGGVGSIEAIEDVRQVFGGDAVAGVGDFDGGAVGE